MTTNSGEPLEVWRGGVDIWECDQMGHMNVRFYLAHAVEGLAGLAAALGMPRAFAPSSSATLLPLSVHIRFLREARLGSPLHMTAGILAISESDVDVLLTLIHTETGLPAATLRLQMVHVTPAGRPFPWPDRVRERAEALRSSLPDYAAPRGLEASEPVWSVGLAEAQALGMKVSGRGAVSPPECDVFGRIRPDRVLARIGQVSYFTAMMAAVLAEAPMEAEASGRRVGSAIVECRIVFRSWPGAGDGIEVHSALSTADARTLRMVNWLLDPVNGQAWASAEMVAITFDLEARKAIALTPEAVALLQARVIGALRP